MAGDLSFWVLTLSGSALQASHQVSYGFGTLYWRSLHLSDTTIDWLWASGVLAEILLFWQAGRLLARLGPVRLVALGGAAGMLRWILTGTLTWLPFIATLQMLHALTFGASYVGAVHFLSRSIPASAAASAQSLCAALSSALGGGLAMIAAGSTLCGSRRRRLLFHGRPLRSWVGRNGSAIPGGSRSTKAIAFICAMPVTAGGMARIYRPACFGYLEQVG